MAGRKPQAAFFHGMKHDRNDNGIIAGHGRNEELLAIELVDTTEMAQ